MELTGIGSPAAAATRRRLPRLDWNEFGNIRKRRVFPRNGLAAYAEALQNSLVALRIGITQIRQKPATLGYHGQQTLPRSMVLLVRLEVLGQQRNALAQQSNLYFWRPGVRLVALI